MEKANYPLLFLLIMYVLVVTVLSEPRAEIVELRCGTELEHNTTAFAANFVELAERILDEIRTTGFGRTEVGIPPDRNYGLVQCYGDLTLPDCVLCYDNANTLASGCFPFTSGIVYLDGCYMRVETYSFFEEITGPNDKTLCGNTTQKGSVFQESARKAILNAAAVASQNKGYARTQVLKSGSNSAYVLANCWRSLNSSSCKTCLDNASESVIRCLPWSEGRVVNTGCFMRYSDRNFLEKEHRRGVVKVSKRATIAIVVSAVAVLVIGTAIGVYGSKKLRLGKRRRASNNSLKMAKTLNDSRLNFKYSTLQKATGSFDEANKLGQGGFGTVYKGVLADGREIAVKRLFSNNRHRAADFYNEVNIVSSVQHKNLVRLLGCSCFGPESLLVYEFLANKSLDHFIFDARRGEELNWEKRYKIIVGTAEGLAYLHENPKNRIIHRDIKASNILLDTKLRAKIADFGLARTFEQDKTHISTAIAGTLGYMAPEYLALGQLTEKADVYAFGVLVLEIVTGRQNNKINDFEFSDSTLTTVWKHFQQGTTEELFDPSLMLHNYTTNRDVKNEILRVMNVGLLCTQEVSSLRPTFSGVLQMLSKKDEQLHAPTKPPFIDEKTMELNNRSQGSCDPPDISSSPSISSYSFSAFHPR